MKISQTGNHHAYDVKKKQEQECMRWLKCLGKLQREQYVKLVLVNVCDGLLIVAQYVLLAMLLHQLIIEQSDWHELSWLMLIVSIVYAARTGCHYIYHMLGFAIAIRIKQTIRAQLQQQIQCLGFAWLKRQQSGHLAALTLEHCEGLHHFFSRYHPQYLRSMIVPLLIISAVFVVNWVVGIILLVTGPLIPLFMVLIGMGAAAASRERFLQLAWMGGYFYDRLQHLTTLKLFGQTEKERQRIDKVAIDFREKTMQVLRIAFMSSAVLEFFSTVAVALVAVYVGLGLLGLIQFGPARAVTLQQALLVLMLAPEYFQPLRQLAVHYHDRAEAIGAATQLLQILQTEVPERETGTPIDTVNSIEIMQVSKSYDCKKVLNGIQLSVKPGEKLALIGVTGAGKSTLLQLILGLERPDTGAIYLGSLPVSEELASRKISWVGQSATIFAGSIADNISLFDATVSRERIEAAATTTLVNEFSDSLTLGLDTQIGEHGYGLSGGQIQRIALARALLKSAGIVLLDEPTAHLDDSLKYRLLENLASAFAGKTLVIATHDMALMPYMHRCVKLVDGRLR